MNILWYALWFIVAVSVLVTVHELGHYWVARQLGFKVLRFSVGFGKPLYKKVAGVDQTEYVLAAWPLGGYVKMLDEREGEVAPHELHRSFTRRPPWQRIAVLLAGPAFNFIFAILLLWGIAWFNGVTEVRAVVGEIAQDSPLDRAGLAAGDEIVALNDTAVRGRADVVFGLLEAMSTDGRAALGVRNDNGRTRTVQLHVTDPEQRLKLTEPPELFRGLGFTFWEPFALPQLGKIDPAGPAAQAGLRAGDIIVSVDERPVSFRELALVIGAKAGENVLLRYRRDGTEYATRVTPRAETVEGRTVGRIKVEIGVESGVRFPEHMRVHSELGVFAALGHATSQAWEMTALQARLLWRMVMGDVSLKNLSGPLSIAEFAGEHASQGLMAFLSFLVLISLSLGFLNLLPIPILDGGQILFQLAEWFKGAPLSERAQVVSQQLGIALLIMLMGVALFNDIARQFH
jgi:regulator of sigma E protease